MKKNLIGLAIQAYHKTGDDSPISTFIDDELDSEMHPSLFFRPLIRMSHIERLALKKCRGKVLDIGAAAGCHSLILQKQGLDVTALEISKEACEVMKSRGVKNVVPQDLNKHKEKYDTILILMNGFGLSRTKKDLPRFLLHLKSLLNKGGQIIGDSTDIHYYQKESFLKKEYYGEVEFKLNYKNEQEVFPWLYADEILLKEVSNKCGMRCEVIQRNRNDAFLVRIIAV